MDEVMVVLAGDSSSLAMLSERFSSPRLAVIQESGGDTGYLKSSDFDSSTDDAKIIDAAERLVHVANGIMRLNRLPFYRPVDVRPAVVRDDEQGKRTVSISTSDTAVINVAEEVTIEKFTAEGV